MIDTMSKLTVLSNPDLLELSAQNRYDMERMELVSMTDSTSLVAYRGGACTVR